MYLFSCQCIRKGRHGSNLASCSISTYNWQRSRRKGEKGMYSDETSEKCYQYRSFPYFSRAHLLQTQTQTHTNPFSRREKFVIIVILYFKRDDWKITRENVKIEQLVATGKENATTFHQDVFACFCSRDNSRSTSNSKLEIRERS